MRKHGVPPGGPFDTESSRLANALVGNQDWVPVLELGSASLKVCVESPQLVAIVGCGHSVQAGGSDHGIGLSLFIQPDEPLAITPNQVGMRAYLAFPGGVWPMKGETNVFEVSSENQRSATRRLADSPMSLTSAPFSVVGNDPLRSGFVSAHSDRTGIQIEVDSVGRAGQSETSRPVVMGAIQSTPSGRYLVHGPDGPTIGGYDLIGVLARADLDRLAQLRPAQHVEFSLVTVEEAREAWTQKEARIRRLCDQIRAFAR